MAKTAITELQEQVKEVRREAFAAGYAAAMQAIRDLASRPAPGASSVATRTRRGTGRSRRTTTRSGTTAATRRRTGTSGGVTRRRGSAARRPQRGGNAQTIEEILQAASPRALRQAEIRKALQEKGREVAFTSIRHALSQLEARHAAEQVGDSKTWRHRGGPA